MKRTINTDSIIGRLRGGVVQGVNEAAMVLQSAATPLTPFLTGDLRNSSHIHYAAATTGGNAEAGIYYQGPGQRYAVYQHEGYPNKKHPGTQMKFLEAPMNDPLVQSDIKAVLQRHIEGALQ